MVALNILHILFAIVSMVLCVYAPQGYDAAYCQTIGWLFLAQNICYFASQGRKNLVGFELFFAIAFFFVNFCYPLFYYETNPRFAFFWMEWNHDVITRATAIAYMGYCWYVLGVQSYRLGQVQSQRLGSGAEAPVEGSGPVWEISSGQYLYLFALTMVSLVAYVLLGGWRALQNVYGGDGDLHTVGLYSYFYVIFTLSAGLMAIFVYRIRKVDWWFYLPTMGVVMVAILATGSRTFVLGIMLILIVGWHNNVRQFRLWEIVAAVLAGTIALFLLQQVRRHPVDEWMYIITHLETDNVLDIFEDLMIDGRNLYVLVDYGMRHAYTYLHGMIIDIATPIPGLAKYVLRWYNEPYEVLSAQDFTTYLRLGENSHFGLGCNMIGDAFRSFGYVGTALSMFGVGYIVQVSRRRMNDSIYAYTIYYLMVSYSVFYNRAGILPPVRTLAWSLAILWGIKMLTEQPKVREWIMLGIEKIEALEERIKR